MSKPGSKASSRVPSQTSLAQKGSSSEALASSKPTSRRASLAKANSTSKTNISSNRSSVNSKKGSQTVSRQSSSKQVAEVTEGSGAAPPPPAEEGSDVVQQVADTDASNDNVDPSTAVEGPPAEGDVLEDSTPTIQGDEPVISEGEEKTEAVESSTDPNTNEADLDAQIHEEGPVKDAEGDEEDIQIKGGLYMQNHEEMEYHYEDDQVNVTNITARLVESPLPSLDDDAFMFINVDYEADPDLPVLKMCSTISRSSSWDWGLEKELYGDAVILLEESATPIMRPSTPVYVKPIQVAEVDTKEVPEEGEGQVTEEINEDAVNYENMLPEETEELDREATIAEIKALIETRDKHNAKNIYYQNLLSEYFRRKRTDEARDGEKSVTDQEKRYTGCMQALDDLGTQYLDINGVNDRNVAEIYAKLQDKVEEATFRAAEFSRFKRTTALAAENSRTGKPIPVKVIDQLESTEQRKEAEVIIVRLENIKLRNKLKRDEQLLRQKEELADGLHLIDFEQLKIENQTYNEKIEERNEDLLKLRKKITNVVQELTHVKEKLQFVQTENVDLNAELAQLEVKVSKERDHLPAIKRQRDQLRLSNTSLKHKNGLLGNIPLLKDFEDKVNLLQEKSDKINNLRDYHQMLAAESLAIKRKIKKAQLLQ